MADHPYAGPNTLTPGDTPEDDPFTSEKHCEKCDRYVEPVAGSCPDCGQDI